MKLETTARILKGALTTVGGVIKRKSAIPVLDCVLIDGQTVRGTDLDMQIDVTVPATSATGKAAIDHRSLLALVRNLPGDETISLTGGKEGATLTFPGGRYDLPTFPADDFPTFNRQPDKPVEIDGEALKRAIEFVAPFASREETRYYLRGVCLDATAAVATDGHRLGCHPLGFDGAPFERAIVPTKTVRQIRRLPAPRACQVGNVCMALDFDGARLITKLIDGKFPDWQRVVPTKPGAHVVIDRAALKAALGRMTANMPQRGDWSAISLAWDGDGRIVAASKRLDWAAVERLSGAADESGHFSANPHYLRGLIASWPGAERITARVIDASSPVVWRADGEAYVVLMPMLGAEAVALGERSLAEWASEGRAAA